MISADWMGAFFERKEKQGSVRNKNSSFWSFFRLMVFFSLLPFICLSRSVVRSRCELMTPFHLKKNKCII